MVTVDFLAGPGTLEEIQAALDACWSANDHVPHRIRMEVGMAAAEIAANILEHAHVANFRMELHVASDEMLVEFVYGGEPALVDLDRVCMPDEMAERGRGLALAQAALRLLSYARDEVGNHWHLVSKAFAAGGTHAGAAQG